MGDRDRRRADRRRGDDVLRHWSKRRRATVGAETLVGRTAVVVRALTPRGQVKLDGEVWEAAPSWIFLPGDEVVIRAVEGLLLDVEPAG